MLIRAYERSDLAKVAALDVSTQIDSVATLSLSGGRLSWAPTPVTTVWTKSHDVPHYLEPDAPAWDDAFVAVRDERVVGFAATALSAWNRRLVLMHMYVDRAARRRGVGRSLLERALASERAAAAQHVWLETQPENVPAIRAYERLGFRIVGLDQTLYGDVPEAEGAIFMSRAIDRQP